ncbi:hypothetical protein GBA52_013302 [Prunus armeniaca]|nr:hypothetical protein GBA52_013302 [Prunus armeniaca]
MSNWEIIIILLHFLFLFTLIVLILRTFHPLFTFTFMIILHHLCLFFTILMTIYEEEVELGRDYNDKSEQEMEVVDDDHDMKINKGSILMPMMIMTGLQ